MLYGTAQNKDYFVIMVRLDIWMLLSLGVVMRDMIFCTSVVIVYSKSTYPYIYEFSSLFLRISYA